ncbi:MAG TPA: TonB-dependent receptor, partial [Candidatus Eisenbacteria bacterium]
DRFDQLKLVWTNQLRSDTEWSSRLWFERFARLTSVGRKQPWEYDTGSPDYWAGNVGTGTEDEPFFATHGDFPAYSRSRSTVGGLKSEFSTQRWRRNTFQAGIEARQVRVASLEVLPPNGASGALRSDFENDHPEAAAYVQNRWEFEGLALNAGLRYDLFTPGPGVSARELSSGRRYKQKISPRLGIAHPISTRDVLSFHYGRNSQVPPSRYLFENRTFVATTVERVGVLDRVRGDPDLDPETSVAYQVAAQHLFTPDLWGQFALFFKDIYGLVTTRAARDPAGNQVVVYSNGDYASARGFEASLVRSFSHWFSAEVNYSYQIATGVASDPRQAQQFLNGGRLYLPISEQPLDWDQRHTLTVQAYVADRSRWDLRLIARYGSGFPYTPASRNDRRPDPAFTNSRRLPSTSDVTAQGEKRWHLWGHDVDVFVDVRNAMNAKNVVAPSFSTYPNPFVGQAGDEYLIYFTETGRAGGAYLRDRDGDAVLDWIPLHDPRAFEEGRVVRTGIKLDF